MCRRFFGLWCLVVLIFVILNHVFGGEVKVFRVFLYCRAVAFFGKLVFVESVVVVGLVIAVVVFGQVFVLILILQFPVFVRIYLQSWLLGFRL